MAANSTTEFQEFLNEELRKYKGVAIPVRASLVERAVVRRLPCSKLHPNPEDEFTHEDVGPSYRIISEYTAQYREVQRRGTVDFEDPLLVEKIKPDGYMILNGHHRWAAAIRFGLKTVPVRIVNLTQEIDIRRAIAKSSHDKRVTMDLDEVIFRSKDSEYLEKKLLFPVRHIYTERIKRGIPALFRFLTRNGYDIWLYSALYYSMEDIEAFFRRYRVHVDGVVTGTGRRSHADPKVKKELASLVSSRYRETITLNNDMIVRTRPGEKEFEQYDLKEGDGAWSYEVMGIIEKLKAGKKVE